MPLSITDTDLGRRPATKMAVERTTAAEARTKLAYENRWKTIASNPKIIVIALFAS